MDTLSLEMEREFNKAEQARLAGNEGQARVCARRAAGIAIRNYNHRHGLGSKNGSAYDLLNHLKESALLPPDLQRVTDHLTLRVTEEFNLPVDADLVAESRVLC